jgi:hypothetical protein
MNGIFYMCYECFTSLWSVLCSHVELTLKLRLAFLGEASGNVEVYVFTSMTQQKITKMPIIFWLLHGDMFRLCLQPSSGQLVVQIRYNYCAYDIGSHTVYMCSTSEIKHSMKP